MISSGVWVVNHWLVKSEPGAYCWDEFVACAPDHWDGVRNYQARNNLREMRRGDRVLFYHSVTEKRVVGIARVHRQAYQDPTTEDTRWVAVDLVPLTALARPVELAEIRRHPGLRDIALLRQSRLSVVPITKKEFDIIVGLGSG